MFKYKETEAMQEMLEALANLREARYIWKTVNSKLDALRIENEVAHNRYQKSEKEFNYAVEKLRNLPPAVGETDSSE